jgi:hypothetical protein
MSAEDAQGTPTQSHVTPRILVYEEKTKTTCPEQSFVPIQALHRTPVHSLSRVERLNAESSYTSTRKENGAPVGAACSVGSSPPSFNTSPLSFGWSSVSVGWYTFSNTDPPPSPLHLYGAFQVMNRRVVKEVVRACWCRVPSRSVAPILRRFNRILWLVFLIRRSVYLISRFVSPVLE